MALSICRAVVCVFFALVDICLLNANTMKVEHLKCTNNCAETETGTQTYIIRQREKETQRHPHRQTNTSTGTGTKYKIK